MTHSFQPERARGTSPLDGFKATSGLPPAEQILRRHVLEAEIAHGERLVSTMRPRVRVVERAIAAIGKSEDEMRAVFAGHTEAEQAYALEVAVQFIEEAELLRKAQILVRQFTVAEEALEEAKAAHAQFVAARLEVGLVEGFSLNKFRGSLYPLYNFSVIFAGRPILGQMFPPMRKPSLTQPLTPPAAPAEPAADAAIDRLSKVVKETPQLAALEPLLDRGVDLLKKAQDLAPGFLSKFGAFKRPSRGEGP
ncbi:MAG TPA: hypothetical protein V6D05_18530 [Stenomitos sp.]